jgi:hypothetical protein
VLLHPLVELTLDLATVDIGCDDEPFPGRTQLGDLEAQPIDRFQQRLDRSGLQVDRPPSRI